MEGIFSVECMGHGELIPGDVSNDQFLMLISISSMHSKRIIQALHEHLVRGASRVSVCERHNIGSGYFSISLKRLQHISCVVADLSKYYIKN
ncbi:TPA: transcriptional regulator [Klebsiella pneumoniae]|nr:transcriptional regulator [Klebsiella pneumoniae]